MEGLTWYCVYGEFEVVGCDGACDIGREGEYSIDCFGSGSVLEDDTQFGKGSCDLGQVGEEVLFGIQDRDVLFIRRWTLIGFTFS